MRMSLTYKYVLYTCKCLLKVVEGILMYYPSIFCSPPTNLAGFSQAVPLVPLSEANEEAMENKNFRKLLRKLGIRSPANEQVCVLFTSLHFIQMNPLHSEASIKIVFQTVNNLFS